MITNELTYRINEAFGHVPTQEQEKAIKKEQDRQKREQAKAEQKIRQQQKKAEKERKRQEHYAAWGRKPNFTADPSVSILTDRRFYGNNNFYNSVGANVGVTTAILMSLVTTSTPVSMIEMKFVRRLVPSSFPSNSATSTRTTSTAGTSAPPQAS